MSVLPGLDAACRRAGVAGEVVARHTTVPIVDYHHVASNTERSISLGLSRAVVDHVRRHAVSNTVLAAYWPLYAGSLEGNEPDASSDRQALVRTRLLDTVRELRAAGSRVWVMLDVPKPLVDVPRGLAQRSTWRPSLQIEDTRSAWERRNAAFIAMRAEIEALGGRLLDPSPLFAMPDGKLAVERDGVVFYSDDNHLTTEGALLLAPLFETVLAP
ncbi:MAG: hypothetical protein DVB31_12990 [Verrucomicrobia bacterium]|nr:MAG: hypothetical protein DVB31_12990 [Verrucomicrobiota bacterium]